MDVIELISIRITIGGLVAKFDKNPYKVYVDLPGTTLGRDMAAKGRTVKVCMTGVYEPDKFFDLLKYSPMYDRANTRIIVDNCVITNSLSYARKAVVSKAVEFESISTLVRFSKMPRSYLPMTRARKAGREPVPRTWGF